MSQTTTCLPDFYSLLQLPRDASRNDIKIAYHRTLLRLHPDKRAQSHQHETSVITSDPPPSFPSAAPVDVALLKEAHRTLSDADLRTAYDTSLRQHQHERARSHGPRPAQVVSLEEFTAVEAGSIAPGTPAGAVGTEASQTWWHGCRCGGVYRITQDDLENGTHLIGCESCSEVIWVGYEQVPITDDEGD